MLIAGRIATGETLSGRGIELAEAGATQMQESNGNQNQGNEDKPGYAILTVG